MVSSYSPGALSSASLSPEKLAIIEDVVSKACKNGADAADALLYESTSLSAAYRLGKLEDIERSESQDLGLRVLVGRKQTCVSSSDISEKALGPLVERAVAMARLAPEDPYCGLAPKDRLAKSVIDLDLHDPTEPSSEQLSTRAAEAEEAGLAVANITNSNGAGAGWGRTAVALCTSDGFLGSYGATSHSLSCSLLAGEGMGMESDYDFATARHLADLPLASDIGKKAAEKAVRKLSPQRVETQSVPVVYDPRVANRLVGHFAGAISGSSVTRGTSFLKEKMGHPVFASGVTVIDEPHRKRGLGSKPFDGEGIANKTHTLIDDGCLTTWILNSATAKQLGLETTGHASRGTGGPPGSSTSNLYMAAGSLSRTELMSDIKSGFYVTDLIGSGVNGVTGDYSLGAGGFWIEDGEISFPVNEVTIAGNLKEMFREITPANDLVFRYGTNAPTLRVEGMTVAGQ